MWLLTVHTVAVMIRVVSIKLLKPAFSYVAGSEVGKLEMYIVRMVGVISGGNKRIFWGLMSW